MFCDGVVETLARAKILGVRAGTHHRYTGVWPVVVEGRLFVRSWNDKPTGWFRAVLAVHIAEMIDWAKLAVTTAELDFALQPYKPFEPKSNPELLEYFDKCAKGAIEALGNTSDEAIMGTWTLRNGETIYFVKPRIEVLRADCFNHFIHHR